MAEAEYEFLTAWLLAAPIDRVWDVLHDVAAWPAWWPAVRATRELAPGSSGGVGRVFASSWRSWPPYTLRFETTVTRIDHPHHMEGQVVGDLAGAGHWRLFERDGMTAVTYEWRVRTTKRWMNALAPVARPLFAHSHDHVMRQGGRGLARRVAGR